MELPRNTKFQLVWGQGRGFLMSEYEVLRGTSKPHPIPKNSLFEIRVVDFALSKIRIDKLQYSEG
jgi:hypothetical protein